MHVASLSIPSQLYKIESCFPGLALPELSGPSGPTADDDRAMHDVHLIMLLHLQSPCSAVDRL